MLQNKVKFLLHQFFTCKIHELGKLAIAKAADERLLRRLVLLLT